MIRRDSGDNWLLISQVDHARIAGELAAAWEPADFEGVPRDELLWAIAHHDDGWATWEECPRIEPGIGRPYDFTEMPMEQSTAIWTRSIARCARGEGHAGVGASSLGGAWVSRHFCVLAEHARESRSGNRADVAAVEQFLAEQGAFRQSVDVPRGSGGGRSVGGEDAVETGYRWVRFFDRISLWLCCAERVQQWRVESPLNRSITFRPDGGLRVRCSPYPLSVPRLELPVSARVVRAARWESQEAFDEAWSGSERVPLRWTIEAEA